MTAVYSKAEGGGFAHMAGPYGGSFTPEVATEKFGLPADRDLKKQVTINLHLEGGDAGAAKEALRKMEEMRQYFHCTYELFEQIFAPLVSDEAYYIAPKHKLRHPLIFYLGHTSSFYINKLVLGGLTSRINQEFEEMFAVGVDEQSWDDLKEEHYEWPAVGAVWKYRTLVRERVDSMFQDFKLSLPLEFGTSTSNANNSFFWTMMMACEHDRIHIETASVHLRELPLRLLKKWQFWAPCTETKGAAGAAEIAADQEMIEFPGGEVSVGRQKDSAVYGWDCDYSDKLVHRAGALKASKYLVTNAAFYEFVKDGGYTRRELWDEEGWNWVTYTNPKHPWFWVPGGNEGEFRLRAVTEEIAMPWDWPCETNQLEAAAYCNWMGEKMGKKLRLPTESEWLHLYDQNIGCENHFDVKVDGNVNFRKGWASSCAANVFKQGKLYDIQGNVWNHTCTPVYPFKGYETHPFYDDFSLPTFEGLHFGMKGGTWVSTGNEATRDNRFAFRRHFFQYIGIRYVEGEDVDEMKYCEGSTLGLDPRSDLHSMRGYYPLPSSGMPEGFSGPHQHFGLVIAELAKVTAKQYGSTGQTARALDLMCGAGRCSFELTLEFNEVWGIDFSARTLQTPYAIKERGAADFSLIKGGERVAAHTSVKNFSWASAAQKASFVQADPCNLHAHLKSFDLIVAFNILNDETTYNPSAVYPHVFSRLSKGGVMLVAEPMVATREETKVPSNSEVLESLCKAGGTVMEGLSEIELYFAETAEAGKAVKFQYAVVKKE